MDYEEDTGVKGDTPQSFTALKPGSVPYLTLGEKLTRPGCGPDAQSMAYESIFQTELAASLNIPLNELLSDYSSGSFSNLRMSWQDANREYSRRKTWFYNAYRLPVFLELLSGAFTRGDLPMGISPKTMAHLKRPKWLGPKRESPQPEKEFMAVAALARAGTDVKTAKEQLTGNK